MKKLNSYWTFINVFHCLIVLSDVGWNLWEYDESRQMKQENGMDTFGKEKMEQKCLLMMKNNIFASFMNIMVNSELISTEYRQQKPAFWLSLFTKGLN